MLASFSDPEVMTLEKAEQTPFGSPIGKARTAHASKLPITAISLSATPPASRPPQQADTVVFSSLAANGSDSSGFSFSSSGQGGGDRQQLAQWLPPALTPPAAAKSPSRAGGSPVQPQRTTWKSQAAVGPPTDLKWSPTMERLIMNSTKQIEAIEQTAQQAVTVVLRNMAPLRKLARGAAGAPVTRDAYGLNIRLGIRQSATAELIEASSCLLDDLAHLFTLLAGQPSAAGQHGRTSGRHIAAIATDLKGGKHQFSEIAKELKLAGRFLLVRDPGAGKNPALDERMVEEGRKDIRQLESVLRAVTSGRNRMQGIWSTLAALQAAGITQDDPSWTLLRGLDINTTADVLASLQLQAKPSLLSEEAAASRLVTDVEMSPEPPASPGLGRPWWRSPSKGSRRSPAASPSKVTPGAGAARPATAGQPSGCVPGLADRLAAAGLKSSISAAAHPHKPLAAADTPPIQIRNLKQGHVYRGGVLKGIKQGLGQLEYSNGCKYDGEFDADEMDGHGVFTFASGGLYQGQFDMGKYHGSGVETFPSGGTYHGEYASGTRSGNGTCTFANGDVYEGQWEANSRHGLGYQQSPDHSSFVGRYRSGKREGHGCYTFSNGDRYTGEYQNDVPHGLGSYHFASGHTYEGQWLNGSKSGYCVYSLASGQQWAGRWENGRPVWTQPLAAAQAEAKTPGGGIKGDLVVHALATAAAARGAADQVAALFKDHWQPEGTLQTGVRRAVQQATAAAEAAASIQEQVHAAISEAVAAVEAAANAKRKGS